MLNYVDYMKMYVAFLSFFNTEMDVTGTWNSASWKDLCTLRSQYDVCWWPGDARSQVISTHGIDLVFPKYFSLSSNGLNVPVLWMSMNLDYRFARHAIVSLHLQICLRSVDISGAIIIWNRTQYIFVLFCFCLFVCLFLFLSICFCCCCCCF